MAKVKRPVIQTHHISKDPEVTVKIYQGEHWIVTQLQRRKRISIGFLECLADFMWRHFNDAIDLRINHE